MTVEAALVLPVLILLTMAGMAAVAVISTQLRCLDAAREAARAAARGEPASTVQAIAARAAPTGAHVAVVVRGDSVTVAVSAEVRYLTRLVPPLTVRARAAARTEPGLPDPTFSDTGGAADAVVVGRPAAPGTSASRANRILSRTDRRPVRPSACRRVLE